MDKIFVRTGSQGTAGLYTVYENQNGAWNVIGEDLDYSAAAHMAGASANQVTPEEWEQMLAESTSPGSESPTTEAGSPEAPTTETDYTNPTQALSDQGIDLNVPIPSGTNYGAGNIDSNLFLNPDGSQKHIHTVALELQQKLGADWEGDDNFETLKNQLRENLPKMGALSEGDMYGLQKQARGLGKQAQAAYGGQGQGMRGSIMGTQDLSRTKDIKQKSAFESDLATFLGNLPQPAAEGGYIFKDGSGVGRNKKSKTTFLDILSKLPDAGGS